MMDRNALMPRRPNGYDVRRSGVPGSAQHGSDDHGF